MDKNTIAGLVIIFLILIGFSYLTRPSKEQVAEMQRKQDSIARDSEPRNWQHNNRHKKRRTIRLPPIPWLPKVILFSYKTIRKTKSSPWKMIK